MYDVPECVWSYSIILEKKNVLAPAALGTKNETRHTFLFRQKLGSPNRFSRPLIITLSTKGVSNNNSCSSILMHSTRSAIKNWRELGRRSVCSMTTRTAERGRPMGPPSTPV